MLFLNINAVPFKNVGGGGVGVGHEKITVDEGAY